MGTWYISADEVTWSTLTSVNIDSASLVFRANGIDELRFSVPGDMIASELFAYGTAIALKYDTTIRFRGRINTIPRQGMGSQESVEYVAVSAWWWFERITYTQHWQMMRSTDNELISAPKPRIIIGQDDSGNRRTLAQEIEAVVDYAISVGAPILKGTIDAGPTVPYSEHTNFRCADVIRQCMRFMPERICYFDHSTSPYPTFNCRVVSSLTEASVDIVNVDAQSLSLTPRYDIQVPGIRITYEQTHSVDGSDYESHIVDTAGDVGDARCLDLLFELAGSSTTFMSQKIETTAYPDPLDNKAFWKGLFAWMEGIDDADLTIDGVARSGSESYSRFLVKGSIQDWMTGVDYEDEVWSVKVSYIRRNSGGTALETVESKELKITLRSTNASTKEYRRVASYDAAETIPSGVADALYASWGRLQWDGSISLMEEEVSFSVGPWTKLNLTNGLTAWSSMAAAVQEVEFQLEDGSTRIKTGPSGVLEADALVSLFRACHARRFAWRATQRTTALIGGSESEGAYQLPREKPSEADPGEKKQLRIAADAAGHEQLIQLDPTGVAFEDSGDAASRTIAPRELLIPGLNAASPAQLVYKRRQVLASEAYHAEQLVGSLIRIKELMDVGITSSAAWDVLRWDSLTSKWINSPIPGVALDLSAVHLGYTIAGGTITLKAGRLKMYGKQHLTISQAAFSLGGTQYFYVHHARSSGAAAWAVAAVEPGVSSSDLDVVFYKFMNGALSEIHRVGGDIDLDLPM